MTITQQHIMSSSATDINAESKEIPIGIDLGTTNSCVCYWDKKESRARVVKIKDRSLTRSVVRYNIIQSNNRRGFGIRSAKEAVVDTVGDDALAMESREDNQQQDFILIESVKRKMGNEKGFDDGLIDKYLTPEQVSADILHYLKVNAEKELKTVIHSAVITVPAHFGEKQREATRRAAEMAGISVLRLLSEPMAAAMAYGLSVSVNKKIVLVIDFGGGTLDISLLLIEDETFKAIAISGDNTLGGDDIDHLIMIAALNSSKNKKFTLSTIDEVKSKLSREEFSLLKRECEVFKKNICSDSKECTAIKFSWKDGGDIDFFPTKDEFNKIISPAIDRGMKLIEDLIEQHKEEAEQIREVVLVGGSTKVPLFRDSVQQLFPQIELCTSIKGFRAVAEGAAVQAAILLGVDKKHLSKVLMLDAVPFSIGVENSLGEFQVMIAKNSWIPTKTVMRFYTHADFQPALSVDIFEGEDPIAHNNKWLGCFDFIVPNGKKFKAGERSLEVSLEVNHDGMLVVNAIPPQDELKFCSSNDGGEGSDEESQHENRMQSIKLSILLMLLILFYMFVKQMFIYQRLKNQPNIDESILKLNENL